MKIFGREPVYVLAFIAIVLKLVSSRWLDLSEAEQAGIMAVLFLGTAVVNAIVLKTGAVGAAIVNLAQGTLALFLIFGADLSAEEVANYMALVEGAVALWLHREVTAPVSQVPLEQSSPVKNAAPTGV
jgi:hypothetical protein